MSRVLPQHLPELPLVDSGGFLHFLLPAAAVGGETRELDYIVGRAGGTQDTDVDRFKRRAEDPTTTLLRSGRAAVGVAGGDAVLVSHPSLLPFLLFFDGEIGVVHRGAPSEGQLLLLQRGENAREVLHVVDAAGLLLVFAGGVGETHQSIGPKGWREGGRGGRESMSMGEWHAGGIEPLLRNARQQKEHIHVPALPPSHPPSSQPFSHPEVASFLPPSLLPPQRTWRMSGPS